MTSGKQIIGNRGMVAHTRSFSEAPINGYPMGGYPGVTNFSPQLYQGGGFPVESGFQPGGGGSGGGGGLLGGLLGGGGSGGESGSGFNLGQLKQVVDRMGGIDGIMNTMTKVQKIVTNVQQMAPMVKLLMGSFGKSKTTGATDSRPYRNRRRNGKRRRSSGTRRPRR